MAFKLKAARCLERAMGVNPDALRLVTVDAWPGWGVGWKSSRTLA